MAKTHHDTTSNDDGVCDKIYRAMSFPCSVFRHNRRPPTTSVEIPISSGSSVIINSLPPPPPPTASHQIPWTLPQPAVEGRGTVKGKSEQAKTGIEKDEVDDEGISRFIERAKEKIRASSTFKVVEGGEEERKKGKNMAGKKVDSLNYKVTNFINRTKLDIIRAPSTL